MASLLISGATGVGLYEGASQKPYRHFAERFWKKAPSRPPSPEMCWTWTAGGDGDGYGAFKVGTSANDRAHRVAWRLTGGEIPAGWELDHACRNRMCVRPEHLTLVEKYYNARQGSATYASRKRSQTHCKNGHEYRDGSYAITPDGWRSCRACVNVTARISYRMNADKILKKAHEHYVRNAEEIKAKARARYAKKRLGGSSWDHC